MRRRCAASTVVSQSKASLHSDGGAGLPDRLLFENSAPRFGVGGAKARSAIGKQSGSAKAGLDLGRRAAVTVAPSGRPLTVYCEELLRELAKSFHQQLEHVGQAQKEMSDAFGIAWWIAVSRRMILLPVPQDAVAVATYRDQRFI